LRILIIDDEPSLVKILSKVLEQASHETFSAPTGAEGLEKAGQLTPDVILLDLHLPDMGGIDILAKLNERFQTASVVVITGEGSVDAAVKAMQMGA